MDIQDALIVFDALSQETRLKTFRLLVEHGPEGAPAGTLSKELGIPHNTLSFHLSHMSNAGLVLSRREGRSIIYTVDFAVFQDLIRFMAQDCCSKDVANVKNGKNKGSILIELPVSYLNVAKNSKTERKNHV